MCESNKTEIDLMGNVLGVIANSFGEAFLTAIAEQSVENPQLFSNLTSTSPFAASSRSTPAIVYT